MLLPQSSAFAALKNRLNSVSAIGFLHIAPRTYVTQSRNNSVVDAISSYQYNHSRQKSTEAHVAFSAPPTAGPSSFDRSSRLKGRDEGGIRWNELLEKFRSVQERARRVQRQGGDLDDGFGMADMRAGDGLSDTVAFRDLAKLRGPSIPTKDAPTAPQPAAQKNKSSLAKFGRLGGGGGANRPKR
jgi:vacuole morphology and inheritance protein 14